MKESQKLINDTKPVSPQASLLPPTTEELSSIISSEANYDRWSNFLFPHIKTRGLGETRTREITFIHEGQEGKGRIEVVPAGNGKCYTDRTYDVLLAVIVIWKSRGMPDEPMFVSLSEIAKQLDLKATGRVTSFLLEELKKLSRNTISWNFTFETIEFERSSIEDQRILDTFKFTEKKDRQKGLPFESRCQIRLSEHIRNNIRNSVTIPINFAARKSIKSSVAKSIYSRIDNILIKNPIIENTATYIVEHYELTPSRYRYKSQRKALVELLVRNLDGVETSRKGVFLSVRAEETKSGNDWKCIFTTRGQGITQKEKSSHKLPIVNAEESLRDYLVSEISRVVQDNGENAGLYHLFALHYSENHIYRAIGEYKEIVFQNPQIKNKKGYFTALVHIIAHKLGMEWVLGCDSNCRYRPENQLFPDDD